MRIPPKIPFYNSLDATQKRVWPDHTLIFPVCAVGNVGQLTCDLLISTLISRDDCHLTGRIYSPTLMSVVGSNPYMSENPHQPTTSMEVYESKKYKLVIVQQRTSCFKETKNIFLNELVDWIKQSQFDRVIVLTSSFVQCCPDFSQIGRYSFINTISTPTFVKDTLWKSLNLKEVSKEQVNKAVSQGLSYLPGSGLTKRLFKEFEKAAIPAAFLIDFCAEGINIRDCQEVFSIIDTLHGISVGHKSKWVEPPYWRAVFSDAGEAE